MLIAANWKMNGRVAMAKDLVSACEGIANEGITSCELTGVNIVLCPSDLHVGMLMERGKNWPRSLCLGAQNCSQYDDGAHTGDVSAAMLADAGCQYVIAGHSERRSHDTNDDGYGGHQESDELVAAKLRKIHECGMIAIVCVGETWADREKGLAQDVIARQIEQSIPDTATVDNTVVAYEPVWAIGSGKAAKSTDVETMHGFIRQKCKERLDYGQRIRILYGGSVKPDNAQEILGIEGVDGALIGGASLDPVAFSGIVKVAAYVAGR